jgi:hypothetical protein
VHIDPTY